MSQRTHKAGLVLLGPRALAVLSCALALMAAQPAVGASGRGVARAEVHVQAAEGVAAQVVSQRPRVVRERRDGVGGVDSLKARPSYRLHVLAGLEILQRWLAAELAPLEVQSTPALFLAPVCVLIYEPVLVPPHRVVRCDSPVMPVERAYAITRHLLAPPTV
jgi:hypothetical protein